MSWICRERKYDNNKQYEKAEKAIDGDEHDLVLCLLSTENKKEDVKKQVWSEADMLCMIDGDTIFSFMKNTSIGDFGASCHITNNNTCMFNVININEWIQCSSSIMLAMKKGKLHVWQVIVTEQANTL